MVEDIKITRHTSHAQFDSGREFERRFREAYSELYTSEEDLVKAMESFDRLDWIIPEVDSDYVRELVRTKLTNSDKPTTPHDTSDGILFKDIR